MRAVVLNGEAVIHANTSAAFVRACNIAGHGNVTNVRPTVTLFPGTTNIYNFPAGEDFWSELFSGESGTYHNKSLQSVGLGLGPRLELHAHPTNDSLAFYFEVLPSHHDRLNDPVFNFMLNAIAAEGTTFLGSIFAMPAFCIHTRFHFVDTYVIQFLAEVTNHRNCSLPGPFFGACCVNGTWQTTTTDELPFSDYLITPTPIYVSSPLTVTNLDFVMRNSSLFIAGPASYTESTINLDSSFISTAGTYHVHSFTISSLNSSFFIMTRFHSFSKCV